MGEDETGTGIDWIDNGIEVPIPRVDIPIYSSGDWIVIGVCLGVAVLALLVFIYTLVTDERRLVRRGRIRAYAYQAKERQDAKRLSKARRAGRAVTRKINTNRSHGMAALGVTALALFVTMIAFFQPPLTYSVVDQQHDETRKYVRHKINSVTGGYLPNAEAGNLPTGPGEGWRDIQIDVNRDGHFGTCAVRTEQSSDRDRMRLLFDCEPGFVESEF